MSFYSRTLRHLGAALALINLGAVGHLAVAGDKTWDNGSTNFQWDTSSLNWTGTAWNNAAGDGAIYGALGLGTISVPGPITANSINFTTGGYTLNGSGPITISSAGSSTLTTGVIQVTSGTVTINTPLTTSGTPLQKIGAGVLELSSPMTLNGSLTLGNKTSDIIIGPWPTGITPAGGTLRLLNSSVLPTTARVAIGNQGFLDIGSNNITLGELTFLNQNTATTPAWLNPNNGVIGAGTLRVTGDISVLGVNSNNRGNSIATSLDLGGGTQVVRIGNISSFAGANALMFLGNLSNGSLLTTIGYTNQGATGSEDGVGLFGNNTYSGSTTINSGFNVASGSVVSGTNASTSLKVSSGFLTILGANGSYGSATTIQALNGSTLILDNNAGYNATGTIQAPTIVAANNNDRINDNASIELRDSSFTYRGASTLASNETYASMNVSGGHNILTITPNGTGGTATLTATGNLQLDSRATLQISGTTLGSAGKVIFNGTVPVAVGGIIPRIISSSDFVFYDATNGFTPYASYASTLTAGSNVALSVATGTVGSVTINALKTTTGLTTTINGSDVLGITTGMVLSASGTHAVAGTGTLAFGNTPGVFFGTNNVSAAITGTQGLLNSSGTLTLSGNLSGLSGTISNIGNGTTLTLSTNTFSGPIEVRHGTLSIAVNQMTGSGLGAVTLGVNTYDSNLVPNVTTPTLSLSAAGANAVFARPIIVDNSALSAGGLPFTSGNINGFAGGITPLSNTTGSQTISGDITLNTPLFLSGGGSGGTGSTNFSGTISGPSTFFFRNGRFGLTSTSVLSNAGGIVVGNASNNVQATFAGTVTGTAPVFINGGNSNVINYAAGSLPTGTLTIQNATGATAPSLVPTNNSTLNNAVVLNGDVIFNPGSGVTGELAGVISGTSAFTKNGAGTMAFSNNGNTATGAVTVNNGTLAVNGNLATSANAVTVNSGGTLGGSGTISRTVTVNSGGSLAPGNSPGNLTVDGNVTLAAGSSFKVEANGTNPGVTHDVLTVAGLTRSFTISGSTLSPTTTSSTLLSTDTMYIAVLNDAASTIVGTFNGIAQDGLVTVVGIGSGTTWTAQVSYTGDVGSAALSGGNDLVLYNFTAVPEPATVALMCVLGAGAAGGWYYRRRCQLKAMDANFNARR